MTDKSATERLRELLDERGVEHRDKHDCIADIEWDSTWWHGIAGIRFLAISHDTPDHPNCLYIDDAYLTPEQAIAATIEGRTYKVKYFDDEVDSREKLEADVRARSIRPTATIRCSYDDVMRWLNRQDAITTKRLSSQSDEQESGEIAANDTAKCEIHDFDDTREKLETDVIRACHQRYQQSRQVLELLDRQAAITEVECIDRWDARAAIENADLRAEIAKLTATVERDYVRREECEKLTAERDDLQGRVDYLESRHCEWSDPNDLGDGCMLRHDELVDKLRAERDELKAEVDAYRSKYDDMEFIVPIDKAMEFTTDPPGYVKKALADMHERIITLTDERDEYREKLSRALDLAHEIGRLQP